MGEVSETSSECRTKWFEEREEECGHKASVGPGRQGQGLELEAVSPVANCLGGRSGWQTWERGQEAALGAVILSPCSVTA